MSWLRHPLRAFQDSQRLAHVGPLARRYFAMNAFDGVVTVIGIVMGTWIAGVEDSKVVLTAGLGAAGAMAVSGFWGAYLTEAAERRRSLEELSRDMLVDLKKTRIGEASKAAVVVLTVVDGLSPFLGAVFVLIPFFVPGVFPDIEAVYQASIATALGALLVLGLFLGKVAGSSMLGYAAKTVVAGIAAIGLVYVLGLAAH